MLPSNASATSRFFAPLVRTELTELTELFESNFYASVLTFFCSIELKLIQKLIQVITNFFFQAVSKGDCL